MNTETSARSTEAIDPVTAQRVSELLNDHRGFINRRTDHLFAGLLAFEWAAAIALAMWRSPRTWDGLQSSIHPHLWGAILLGGVIAIPPILLSIFLSGTTLTRHCIAIGQMLLSALLIHVGDGRIEMHFHVFGSLAFLSFYRDWRVLSTATAVVVLDHLLRGLYIPQSVYGVAGATFWRTLEHGGWVVFEDIFLITSCVQGVKEMHGIALNRALLEQSHRAVEEKVVERTQQLRETQQDLMKAARSAGMAEIAISVLHNVGNALNSVNVASNVVTEKLRASEIASLEKVGGMIHEHQPDIGQFLTTNPQGKLIPEFIVDLARCLGDEQREMLKELGVVTEGIEHIKQVVSAQQSLAKRGNFRTEVVPTKLVETAITMQLASNRTDIEIVREFTPCPAVPLDEHKVLQILINLISNARSAVMNNSASTKRVTVKIARVNSESQELLQFRVIDTGTGIAAQHLPRLFSHGFTTKPDGHGFGLHGAFNAAREMGGTLTAASDGEGKGAVFTLEIPIVRSTQGELCKA